MQDFKDDIDLGDPALLPNLGVLNFKLKVANILFNVVHVYNNLNYLNNYVVYSGGFIMASVNVVLFLRLI